MDTLLNQIIDQLLPNLDPDLKSKVKEKVALHLIEYLKKRIFKDDITSEESFENDIASIKDTHQRSEEYGKRLGEKLESLSQEQKETILNDAMKELAEVIYKVYNTVRGKNNV